MSFINAPFDFWHPSTQFDDSSQPHTQSTSQQHQHQQQQQQHQNPFIFNSAPSTSYTPAISHHHQHVPSIVNDEWRYDSSVDLNSPHHHHFYDSASQNFQSQLHRRAHSNSSIGTYESTSPYTHSSPLPLQFTQQHYLTAPPSYPAPLHSPLNDYYYMASAGKTRSQLSNKMDGSGTGVQTSSGQSLPGSRAVLGGALHAQEPSQAPVDGDENKPTTNRLPKLDRTMTDIYQDNLYDPNQQFTAAAEQPPLPPDYETNFLNPNRQVQQAVNAANQARSTSPADAKTPARAVSPFKKGSEYFTSNQQIQTAAQSRRQQKAVADQAAYQQHHPLQRQQSDVKTISPKDAVLDYNAAEDNPASLFPDAAPAPTNQPPMYGPHTANNPRRTGQVNRNNSQASPGASQYGAPSWQQSSSGSQEQPDFPAHLVSMETTKSEASDQASSSLTSASPPAKPAQTTAGSGTYTCTYHGCSRRFGSPAELQRHKRDDHRSTGHGQATVAPSNESAHNMTQAGPHRCDRVNPQTGKPCNAVFSRPYDLTRHEDTIHNRQKTKVRCPYCTEEKTFSRNDALTRHLKVVHPQVPIPGKQRKSSAGVA